MLEMDGAPRPARDCWSFRHEEGETGREVGGTETERGERAPVAGIAREGRWPGGDIRKRAPWARPVLGHDHKVNWNADLVLQTTTPQHYYRSSQLSFFLSITTLQ
jgi:hypothetical protein